MADREVEAGVEEDGVDGPQDDVGPEGEGVGAGGEQPTSV